MKISFILISTAAVVSALAEIIQLPDFSDGSYIISIDGKGKPTWTDITVNTTDSAPAAIPKRDAASNSFRANKRYNWPSGTYPWCPGGDWFLQNDFYQHGWDAFYAQCKANGDHKFPKNTVFANCQGTSVSYMCAYTTNPCNVNEWADAVGWAASNCKGRRNGWMEPGYLHVPGWHRRYGYAKSGASIC
ncbi:hypothetical protein GQ607_011400 [Colletotrichum asianum]|uniref:Secreted protein n=1 Tax=Colletotrichum asianum TaxID=702518 RepID=A0A8H3ZMX8_9PEZI|nr:hypothetical protein GQ607_011400 [Colletotrichum asianum]